MTYFVYVQRRNSDDTNFDEFEDQDEMMDFINDLASQKFGYDIKFVVVKGERVELESFEHVLKYKIKT